MRSIPFDTVAMLGLNFDKFPRKESAIQFDLIAMHPKVGDRNIKENDKHLFLETILSANKQLYLSYIGRGASDNAKLLPSSLVEELLDYISDGLVEKIDVHAELITLHPLHGFSNKYNARNQSLYSYLGDAIMPMPGQRPPQPPQQSGVKEIDLNDFISFFKNPFKHYYNRQLSIYYEDSASVLDETEVFDIDHLLKWQLQHDLILLEPNEIENYRIKAVKNGLLPLKNASKVGVESLYEDIQLTKSLYDDCRNNELMRFENFQLPCGSTHIISGKIEELHGNKFIELSFSKYEYKYLLGAFIKHLIVTCTGLATESCFVSKAKKNVFVFETITSNEAMGILIKLLEYYEEGQQAILPYYIDFSEKPSKLIDYDEMDLVGMINGHVDNYNYPLSDAYVLKEYYDGYFEEGNNASEFLENYRTIHTFLSETIPSYTF
ncbi:MAG: exodeoxyribonuclease V subunit gamma [Bacteroidetes bacterium]|nr:exodeoxyribonuclease V subunit gamma [Bacteroidota bacterium]